MKIYYDENMPFAAELFSPLGEVQSFAGRQCTAELIKDADVLLVRSITKVNESLIKEAKNLKFVGTATIGTDHVDQEYLAQRGICFTSAPGCNAISVAEYVLSAIKVLEQRYLFSLQDKTVGIVGAGNTGSRLSEKLDALGVNYLLCDPLLAAAGDNRTFVEYQQVLLEADILSFHVPLTAEGDYPTHHLFGEAQLAQVKSDAVIINACRGEVLDNLMLLKAKQNGNNNPLVLDVWAGEPAVLTDLVPFADIATAHIAGYSFEGKARGTFMLYQALCKLLDKTAELSLERLLPPSDMTSISLGNAGQSMVEGVTGSVKTPQPDYDAINRVIHLIYDVRRDDAIFRQHIHKNGFDWIRKTYPVRREFSALAVFSQQQHTFNTLINLGFKRGE
ncbi:MAG: 4-phosphoerythronate dehydrogenase [Algicola sp.]|nr:4-phosphoerythronate dehydrogenase [Algicola sp.]